MKVLITGGAGFIGLRVARALINQGSQVRILDNFSPQIHATDTLPDDLVTHVELIKADIRDHDAMAKALQGVEGIVHLAAETGTGQSMYEIDRYFSVNVQGTATMLDLLQNTDCAPGLRNIVVASSRAVYGEGAYQCVTDGVVFPQQRTREHMAARAFDPICPICGGPVRLIPTPESSPFMPMSMYGLTKQGQEQAVLLLARTRGISSFALRYQNVYGPGQSLKNPYTGILAVFSNLARQNKGIEIYEDGMESRDFVYIDDVVEATIRSVNYVGQFVGPINIGSGKATSVITVAEEIIKFYASKSLIRVSGAFRMGDIRHNIADISKLNDVLGFLPKTGLAHGLAQFATWASTQPMYEDRSALATEELRSRGLANE
jgi:dTDP-L-rhamnose 4-epimerase